MEFEYDSAIQFLNPALRNGLCFPFSLCSVWSFFMWGFNRTLLSSVRQHLHLLRLTFEIVLPQKKKTKKPPKTTKKQTPNCSLSNSFELKYNASKRFTVKFLLPWLAYLTVLVCKWNLLLLLLILPLLSWESLVCALEAHCCFPFVLCQKLMLCGKYSLNGVTEENMFMTANTTSRIM